MNEATVIGLADRSLWVALQVGGPILGISLVVGVVVSLIQAVTQVQEQTLTFVPKLAAVAVSFSIASTALLPSCTPTTLPAMSALVLIGESPLTTMIWWFSM